MPPALRIDSTPLAAPTPARLYDAVTGHPAMVASAAALIDRGATPTPVAAVRPSRYVFQKEFAAVPRSTPLLLGSDRATTCHILVASSPARAFCTHLDGSPGQTSALLSALRETFADGPDVDLHLAGGFLDDREDSLDLGRELFWALNTCPGLRFHLKSACVGPLNSTTVRVPGPHGTVETAAPLVRALAIDVQSGDAIPNAWFDDLGPDADRRNAYAGFGALPLVSATDPTTGEYRIERTAPFQWTDRRVLHHWLEMDDLTLLDTLSTSPLVEHETFCEEMRANLRYMISQRGDHGTHGIHGTKNEEI